MLTRTVIVALLKTRQEKVKKRIDKVVHQVMQYGLKPRSEEEVEM
jgi:hypothetical protein